MGLDVYAYSKVKMAENQGYDADGHPLDENGHRIFVNPYFPGRCDEFPDGSVVTHGGDGGHFFGRSYGGYSFWRNQLAELAGYPDTEYEGFMGRKDHCHAAGAWEAESGPFKELIEFSDCEGCIGTAVSTKLANDFQEFQAKAETHQDERFRDGYSAMKKAFETAADGGYVLFS